MLFRDNDHAIRWAEAVDRAGALRDDNTVKADFAASLFTLTALPGMYQRVKQHIHEGWIDFDPILNELGLSGGERTLAALAGNLYNGGFFNDYTPLDIIGNCDAETVQVAANAIVMRKRCININEIYS